MKRFLIITLIAQMLLIGNALFACTVFYATDGKTSLAGNNEDRIDEVVRADRRLTKHLAQCRRAAKTPRSQSRK